MPFSLKLKAAVATIVLFAGLTSAQAASPPFTIDVVLSMTGPAAAIGRDESQALGIFEKTVNASGGIGGRPIHFVIFDDQTNPQIAVQLTSTILQEKPNIFMGASMAGSCAAMSALVVSGPVQFCLSPAFIPKAGSYAFGSAVSTEQANFPTLNYLRARGLLRVALLSTTDASGQAGERGVDDALASPEGRGFTVVVREHYAPNDVTVEAQAARIAASGAQVIILQSAGTPTGTALRSLNDAGIRLPVVSNSSNMDVTQLKQYAGFMPSELLFPSYLYVEHATSGPLKQPQAEFYNAFRAAAVRPTIMHSLAWDPALIVVTALRRLGTSASAAQLRDYIATLHGFAGINGVYDFRDSDGHGLTRNALVIIRWDPKTAEWIQVSGENGSIHHV